MGSRKHAGTCGSPDIGIGIQRRWLAFCNPGLREVLTKWLGNEAWITNLDLLTNLRQHSCDPTLQKEWNLVSCLSHLAIPRANLSLWHLPELCFWILA